MSFEPRSNPQRFDSRADDYARYRPSYPAAAIDAILAGLGEPQRLQALDVGAGTGIATGLLAARGVRVTGIEPNADMREAAAAGLAMRAGHADALGAPSGSIDLVTCFQAFHWFANAESIAEFARVLRGGGRVAVVWNERDDADAFTAAYSELVDNLDDRSALAGFRNGSEAVHGLLDERFTGVRVASFPNRQRLDREGLLGRLRSSSYAPTGGAAYAAMAASLDALFERFARDGHVEIVYRTDVFSGEKS